MNRTASQVLADIEAFQPEQGNWLGLEALLTELWSAGVSAEAQSVLLRVFDRFPEDDGAGVVWSIVRGQRQQLPFELRQTQLSVGRSQLPVSCAREPVKPTSKSLAGFVVKI